MHVVSDDEGEAVRMNGIESDDIQWLEHDPDDDTVINFYPSVVLDDPSEQEAL